MEQLHTITFAPIASTSNFLCEKDCADGIATLDVFKDGEFFGTACPECIVNIPGYFAELEPDDITNIWNVVEVFNAKPVLDANGNPKSLGHIYGVSMIDARERASHFVGTVPFMVRRLRARDISRMMKGTPVPSDVPAADRTAVGGSPAYTVIGTDDMRRIRKVLREQPAEPTKPLDQIDDMRSVAKTFRIPAEPETKVTGTNYFVQESNAGKMSEALNDVIRMAQDEAGTNSRTVAGEIVVDVTDDGKPASFSIKFSG